MVRERVRQGWTQRAEARDASGAPCPIKDPDAVSWCLRAAIIKEGAFTAGFLTRAIRDRGFSGVDEWNDHPGRTQAEVIALLDEILGDGDPVGVLVRS